MGDELDTIEKGTPDLERQIRGAQVAVDEEEAEQRAAAPDGEPGERIELWNKASLARYLMAADRGRLPDGAEAELQAAVWAAGRPAGVGSRAIPMALFAGCNHGPA